LASMPTFPSSCKSIHVYSPSLVCVRVPR
jgi:hypothetical protein